MYFVGHLLEVSHIKVTEKVFVADLNPAWGHRATNPPSTGLYACILQGFEGVSGHYSVLRQLKDKDRSLDQYPRSIFSSNSTGMGSRSDGNTPQSHGVCSVGG